MSNFSLTKIFSFSVRDYDIVITKNHHLDHDERKIATSRFYRDIYRAVFSISFAYSRRSTADKNGCTLCANALMSEHIAVDTSKRHFVSINDSNINIYLDSNSSSTFIGHQQEKMKPMHTLNNNCPITLRRWEGDKKRF